MAKDTNDSDSTESENNAESEETENSTIDVSELDSETQEKLMAHPQVRKFVEYNETSLPQIAAMLDNIMESEESEETFTLFVEGVADRSGRVKPRTVRKVLRGVVEEYNSVEE